MIVRQSFVASVAAVAIFSSVAAPLPAAAPPATTANPDFTQGGQIPDGATHDWNLGPTGVRGWMYSNKMEWIDDTYESNTEITA